MEMQFTQAVGFIRTIEDSLDLLGIKLNNWSIWPLFRMHCFKQILPQNDWPSAKPSNDRTKPAINQIRRIAKDFFALSFPKRCDLLCFTCSSWHSELRDNKLVDILFDDYIVQAKRASKFEFNNGSSGADHSSRYVDSDFTNAYYGKWNGSVTSRCNPNSTQRDTAEKLVAALLPHLREKCPTNVQVARDLLFFETTKKQWTQLFLRTKTKVVLLDDGYYRHDVICGALEAGCAVVELQHGAFTPGGLEYCWGESAEKHKATMPLPTKLAIFGNYFEKQLLESKVWQDRLAVIGMARIDRIRKRCNESYAPKSPLSLLVTCQGVAEESLLQLIDYIDQRCDQRVLAEIIIRPHPGYGNAAEIATDMFANRKRIRVSDIANKDETTIGLISKCDIHMSISSACLYESIALGKHTVIAKLPWWEVAEPLVKADLAHLVTCGSDLLEYMMNIFRGNRSLPRADSLFMPEAVFNFRRLMLDYGVDLVPLNTSTGMV